MVAFFFSCVALNLPWRRLCCTCENQEPLFCNCLKSLFSDKFISDQFQTKTSNPFVNLDLRLSRHTKGKK